jgi:hypothetical protein
LNKDFVFDVNNLVLKYKENFAEILVEKKIHTNLKLNYDILICKFKYKEWRLSQ